MISNDFRTLYNEPSFVSEIYETDKFTTQNIVLSAYRLIDEKAPLATLAGRIIQRGTKNFDSPYKLTRYLYSLNGAILKANTVKLGDYQVFLIALKILNEGFFGQNLFEKSLSLLEEIFLSPLLDNGNFKENYFLEEKNNLLSEIRTLINDRPRYALERFIKIMCKNERFGISNLGTEEEVERITNSELTHFYFESILRENRFLHFVGEFNDDNIDKAVNAFKLNKSDADIENCSEIIVKHKPEVVIEKEKIQQTWLFLGYRYNIPSNNPLYGALLLFNAIFGKFSTSRLFAELREKMGLCYYISSSIPANKNILIVSSAIIWKNYKKIVETTEKIRLYISKDIGDNELNIAKKLTISGLNSIEDDSLSLISSRIEFLLRDPLINLSKIKEWVEDTNIEDVKRVASELWLDTIYALRGEL
jgi:predicted Zn-dependent peptidase